MRQARDARSRPEYGKWRSDVARSYSGFNEYRSGIACFAVLIGGTLIFVSISGGTQFHQLAIGTVMSSITLALALALFELAGRVARDGALLLGTEELTARGRYRVDGGGGAPVYLRAKSCRFQSGGIRCRSR